jgi:hypothetical protein
MPSFALGQDCKLYRNTGTYAAPTWDEVPNVKDLDLNLEKGEADVSTRGGGGWEQIIATLKKAAVDFDMVWKPGDADFAAFRDGYLQNVQVECLVLDGDRTIAGSQGLRASMEVLGFSRSEKLTEGVMAKVKLKPGLNSTPSWYVAT